MEQTEKVKSSKNPTPARCVVLCAIHIASQNNTHLVCERINLGHGIGVEEGHLMYLRKAIQNRTDPSGLDTKTGGSPRVI